MFIATNPSQVIYGGEGSFEQTCVSRDSYLARVREFLDFHIVRGPAAKDHLLYSLLTVWLSRREFEDRTRTEAFRAAHRGAANDKPLYLAPPRFEGFDIIQTVTQS